MFSYGPNNSIELDASQITQIVGKNGFGKSSIPLILEEVLYNKNSKGIKKANILNRYVSDKKYSNSIEFEKDGDEYIVSSSRGTTQVIKITKNGEDISAHTATATFDILENILGIDHKAFTQLVYQSSSKSLEFLTATDTTRKKFLIDLLNLNKYTEIFESLKTVSKQVNEDLVATQRSVDMISSWIAKNTKEDLTIRNCVFESIEDIDPLVTEVAKLEATLKIADETNKKIIKNNQYKTMLDSIDVGEATKRMPSPIDTSEILSSKTIQQKVTKDADSFIKKINSLGDSCPTCLQTVSKDFTYGLIIEQQNLKNSATKLLESLGEELDKANEINTGITSHIRLKESWESYNSLYDSNIGTDLVDKTEVSEKISMLNSSIKTLRDKLKTINEASRLIEVHNSRVKLILEQMSSMEIDLYKYSTTLSELNSRTSRLQILQKAFSTSGLVAYKIECMVKDLEELVNVYLAELSDGRFQLTFKIASDKLNVIITDNGKDIEILALSNGELARVNTATLLAIRKLMQQLSSTKINLLILDETVDALDVDGKEKLVEVLLKEEHLNTFLVSHGFSHPLLDKLNVVKENNISRIET